MSSIITTATSGLLASQVRINAAATNIANADTKGYKPLEVTQTADTNGVVSAQVSTGATDVSIEQELVNTQLAANQFTANATVIKAEQKRQGSLIDIFS